MDKRFLTIDKIAERLGIRPSTINNWLIAGSDHPIKKHFFKIGKRNVMSEEGYELYLKECEVGK